MDLGNVLKNLDSVQQRDKADIPIFKAFEAFDDLDDDLEVPGSKEGDEEAENEEESMVQIATDYHPPSANTKKDDFQGVDKVKRAAVES